jgi:hypothetical protein
MKERQKYVVGEDYNYINWIKPLGFTITNKLEEANLICGTGGEDWHPSWYNCKNPHPTLSCNINRDKFEWDIFNKAINLKIPIVGICRSSQILPVLVDNKKGKIVQHQNNPSYFHLVKTHDNLIIQVTSDHHNAAWPYDLEANQFRLLSWSDNLLNFRYLNADIQNLVMPETEVVYYPSIRAIGYQMHPEWDLSNDKMIKWCQDVLINFLF